MHLQLTRLLLANTPETPGSEEQTCSCTCNCVIMAIATAPRQAEGYWRASYQRDTIMITICRAAAARAQNVCVRVFACCVLEAPCCTGHADRLLLVLHGEDQARTDSMLMPPQAHLSRQWRASCPAGCGGPAPHPCACGPTQADHHQARALLPAQRWHQSCCCAAAGPLLRYA